MNDMTTKLSPLLLARYGLEVALQHYELGLITFAEFKEHRSSFKRMINAELAKAKPIRE